MNGATAAPADARDAARERRVGWLCALGVLAVWVGFQLSGRLAVHQALTTWDLAALRYSGAFVAVLPLAFWHGVPRIPPRRLAAVLASAAFGFPLFAYLGFANAPAAHGAVVLSGALPVVTALLAWLWLGEGLARRRLLGLAAVAGALVLLGQDAVGALPGAWLGDLFFLAGTTGWAIYTLLVRRWRLRALDATIVIGLAAAPLYLPVWWLALPSNLGAVPLGAMLYQMVYQGVLAVVVAGFLYTRAVTAIGPANTTLIGALVPGLVALGAWPLLGEPLGPLGFAGVVLASLGMVLGLGRGAR